MHMHIVLIVSESLKKQSLLIHVFVRQAGAQIAIIFDKVGVGVKKVVQRFGPRVGLESACVYFDPVQVGHIIILFHIVFIEHVVIVYWVVSRVGSFLRGYESHQTQRVFVLLRLIQLIVYFFLLLCRILKGMLNLFEITLKKNWFLKLIQNQISDHNKKNLLVNLLSRKSLAIYKGSLTGLRPGEIVK